MHESAELAQCQAPSYCTGDLALSGTVAANCHSAVASSNVVPSIGDAHIGLGKRFLRSERSVGKYESDSEEERDSENDDSSDEERSEERFSIRLPEKFTNFFRMTRLRNTGTVVSLRLPDQVKKALKSDDESLWNAVFRSWVNGPKRLETTQSTRSST
ncbi:unnamed protein product [Phytophthora fragariaefolia]|uniref:RxLR effector protein n=1 Tax=Phytophthora fragariaefolia TaxID=1490495 RepID=A0A9W6XWG3_9STRA|nr:unnamed protein product [Phytophthora fragariaefolia]